MHMKRPKSLHPIFCNGPGHNSYGLNGTKSKPTFCHGDNLREYNTTIFMVRGCPPGMGISMNIDLFKK